MCLSHCLWDKSDLFNLSITLFISCPFANGVAMLSYDSYRVAIKANSLKLLIFDPVTIYMSI